VKKSRRKKLILFLCILMIPVILALVIPRFIDPNRYNAFIVSEIQKRLGGTVRLGPITWGISNGIWFKVEGFSVVGATALPVDFELPFIKARISVIPLLSRKVVIKTLRLEAPLVNVRLEPARAARKSIAVEVLPVAETGSADIPLPVEVLIRNLFFENGRVTLEDALTLPGRTTVRLFRGVDIEVRNLFSGEEITYRLSLRDDARPGLGSLRAEGSLAGLTRAFTLENPHLKVKASLYGLDMDAVRPYLKKDRITRRLGGSMALKMDYEGDLGMNGRAEGVIDLTHLTYTDPSWWKGALPGAKTNLIYGIALSPHELVVDKMCLELGALSVCGKARVDRSKEPVIKDAVLTGDLPLVEVARLVPWGRMGEDGGVIRAILEAGGRAILHKAALPEIRIGNLPPFDTLLAKMEVTADISGISVKPSPEFPRVKDIAGTMQLVNGDVSILKLTGRVGQAKLPEISAKVGDLLDQPRVDIHLKGPLEMDKITDGAVQKLLHEVGIRTLAGRAEMDLALGFRTAAPRDLEIKGKVGLRDLRVETSFSPAGLQGLEADILFQPGVAEVSKCTATIVVPGSEASREEHFTLEWTGRVENWQQEPVLILKDLRTSQIRLPPLATLVSWEKLNQTAQIVKQVLLAGGEVTVESLSFAGLHLKNPPRDAKSWLVNTKGKLNFSGISVQLIHRLPRLEEMAGRLILENGGLSATKVRGRMGPLTLPLTDIRITDLTNQPNVLVRAKGVMRLETTPYKDAKGLLNQYGLDGLSGMAETDLKVQYDPSRPVHLEASGSLDLDDIRAKTYPGGVILDGLRGRVKFFRKEGLDVSIEGLRAVVNQAPVKLEGSLRGGGTPRMMVEAEAQAQRLDLADLAELVPSLKYLGLRGILDGDLDGYITRRDPSKIRLTGSVKARGMGFRMTGAGPNVTVANVDTQLMFRGSRVEIRDTTLEVNDQKLAVTGELANPLAPTLQLQVKSAYMDLDRLIPTPAGTQGPESKAGKPPAKMPSDLVPLYDKATVRLRVDAEKGTYRGEVFKDLRLTADYERGVLKKCDLATKVAGGQIRVAGSADLRERNRVLFSAEPSLNGVLAEKMARLFGIDTFHIHGPLTMTGRLEGRVGRNEDLVRTLKGTLEWKAARGRLIQLGPVGTVIGKVFTFLSLRSLLFVRLKDDLAHDGIPFEQITGGASFENGTAMMASRMESSALNGDAEGTVDLIKEELDLNLGIQPLVTLDKALDLVPLVGKAAGDLTKIYLTLKGPLDAPKIGFSPTRTVTSPLKRLLEIPKGALEWLQKEGEGREDTPKQQK
jgi:hypothetical protein